MTLRQELLSEIVQEETRLAKLKEEIEVANDRLSALREQLAAEPIERMSKRLSPLKRSA